MSKVALFLPTAHKGGLDVFEASIKRQTIRPDIIFVADTLERIDAWEKVAKNLDQKISLLYPSWNLGDIRNLAKAYNEAAINSVDRDIDLFISLQDYIWIPENGIERFVHCFEVNPNSLVTGITHISDDPDVSEIKDIGNDYSIFAEPFFDKPKTIGWTDVRSTDIYGFSEGDIFYVYPEHWEANWASVPVKFFKDGFKWDSEYDRGIAYENQDFAKQCVENGDAEVLIDLKNIAISLPHKKYWPNEQAEIEKFSNRWLFESKWA